MSKKKQEGPNALYARKFINFLLEQQAIRLNEITLSYIDRVTPYDVDLNLINSKASINQLGQFFAEKIVMEFGHEENGKKGLSFDILFSPASNKVIHLAATTIMALHDLGYTCECIHGEIDSNPIIKSFFAGKRILIIDGVIAAGRIIDRTVDVIRANKGIPIGAIVGFDRMEEWENLTNCHSIDQIRDKHKIHVMPIATVAQLIHEINSPQHHANFEMRKLDEVIKKYRICFGVPTILPATPPDLPSELLTLPL